MLTGPVTLVVACVGPTALQSVCPRVASEFKVLSLSQKISETKQRGWEDKVRVYLSNEDSGQTGEEPPPWDSLSSVLRVFMQMKG